MDEELKDLIKKLRDELGSYPVYKIRDDFDPWSKGAPPEFSDLTEIDLEPILTDIDEVLNDLE